MPFFNASRLAAFGLQVHDWMAGMFLAFARLGEQAVNSVSARGGQFVFDAPDFLVHQVASGFHGHDSNFSPLTRWNSRTLLVTSVRRPATACPAISKS